MCGTDTAGRGAWEPPPAGGARTKLYSTENSSSANRILWPRQKQNPDEIPNTKEGFYLDLFLYFSQYCSSTIRMADVLRMDGLVRVVGTYLWLSA